MKELDASQRRDPWHAVTLLLFFVSGGAVSYFGIGDSAAIGTLITFKKMLFGAIVLIATAVAAYHSGRLIGLLIALVGVGTSVLWLRQLGVDFGLIGVAASLLLFLGLVVSLLFGRKKEPVKDGQ